MVALTSIEESAEKSTEKQTFAGWCKRLAMTPTSRGSRAQGAAQSPVGVRRTSGVQCGPLEARRRSEPEHEIQVLDRLSGGALDEVVEAGADDQPAGSAVHSRIYKTVVRAGGVLGVGRSVR